MRFRLFQQLRAGAITPSQKKLPTFQADGSRMMARLRSLGGPAPLGSFENVGFTSSLSLFLML